MQPDTIVSNPANPQNFNRYSYVVNNPVLYTDPTGNRCEEGDENIWGYCDLPSPDKVKSFQKAYINAIANKYGIVLAPGDHWDYDDQSLAESLGLPTQYGVTPYTDQPSYDGSIWFDDGVYITNFSFEDLSEIEFASVLVHEARHSWYEYFYEDEGNLLSAPDRSQCNALYCAWKILTEADAYTVQIVWLNQHGVDQGDFYDNHVIPEYNYYIDEVDDWKSPHLPIPIGICQPLKSWCGQ